MRILVPGAPIAKKRPRFARRGKFVQTYNEQETEEGKWLLLAKGQITEALQGPIKATFIFHMSIPKSAPKKMREKALAEYVPHIKKPDLDNLIKFVKDCLNGVAWHDDSQVCEIEAWKCYSEKPCTEIIIEAA